jgi:cytochrome c556
MRYPGFIKLFITLAITLVTSNASAGEDREITVSQPPLSIEQWYKPANKRQVWLHTMFRLRREMQAMTEYAAFEDKERLVSWSEKFVKDYRSIGEMVPEWADELETEQVEHLVAAANKGDFAGVATAQQKIGQSCMGCHKEYRAVTAALLRGANFSTAVVEDGETMEELQYKDFMVGLSTAMNRIVIAIDDNRFDVATSAYELLGQRIDDLKESCSACHKTDRQRDYLLGTEAMAQLQELGRLIEAKEVTASQRALGGMAVEVCATCHSIHRTVSDLREFIEK